MRLIKSHNISSKMIAFTASGMLDYEGLALESGFDAFLRKPASIYDLISTLSEHLVKKNDDQDHKSQQDSLPTATDSISINQILQTIYEHDLGEILQYAESISTTSFIQQDYYHLADELYNKGTDLKLDLLVNTGIELRKIIDVFNIERAKDFLIKLTSKTSSMTDGDIL